MLVEPDACHIKSKAILKIGQTLRQPFPVLATPLFVIPGILRDVIYDTVLAQPDAFCSHCRLKEHWLISGRSSQAPEHGCPVMRVMVASHKGCTPVLVAEDLSLHVADCWEPLQYLWQAGCVRAAA